MYPRRSFLVKTGTAIAALAAVQVSGIALTNKLLAKSSLLPADGYRSAIEPGATPRTVEQVIGFIFQQISLSPRPDTVDTLKCGKPDQVVTGIVTTMFPTVEVIEETARLNANFIIAHEPSFYNHTDDRNWVPGNSVLKKKLELLDKHEIAVWRFHDNWHRYRPDGISRGFLESTGWLNYNPQASPVFNIDPLSLGQLVGHLKKSLGISHLRVIGDLNQECRRVGMLLGAAGGQRQVSLAESEKPDVLLVGESSEWETPEYFRDSTSLGGKTAYIILGHAMSEEPGMKWLAEWLSPKLPALKTVHIASNDPFTWM